MLPEIYIDACIGKGIFLVQSRVDLPSTFGGQANVTLSRLVRPAKGLLHGMGNLHGSLPALGF